MSKVQDVIDRFEILALQSDVTDALMTGDYERLVGLFTEDGAVRVPHINAEAVGHQQMRSGGEKARHMWSHFVQITHPGSITLDGDMAGGRAYLVEFGQFRDGSSHRNYRVYYDRYRRTTTGWKFAERVYDLEYLDTTPLEGAAPTS